MSVDLLDLLAALDEPALVAPLTFTTDVYPLVEFTRSRQAWIAEHGSFASVFRCHMWNPDSHGVNSQPEASGHAYVLLDVWLGCEDTTHRGQCSCVGGWLHRAVCDTCTWASPIAEDTTTVVAAWHDHAWPGWRDLPAVDDRQPDASGARDSDKRAASWAERIEGLYPAGWARPGAPIVTRRHPGGTRDVPKASPWGGFDLADLTQTA